MNEKYHLQKEYHDRCLKKGKCPHCGKPADPGYKSCARRRAMVKASVEKRKRRLSIVPPSSSGDFSAFDAGKIMQEYTKSLEIPTKYLTLGRRLK